MSENTFREGEQNSHAQAVTILFPVRLDRAVQFNHYPAKMPGGKVKQVSASDGVETSFEAFPK